MARGGFEVELALSPDLPRVPGHAELLRTAFDNLLSNARNHAGGGQWIRVSAAYFAAEKEVRISVKDRGAGVDPADQVEIFEPFCRGRAAIEAQILAARHSRATRSPRAGSVLKRELCCVFIRFRTSATTHATTIRFRLSAPRTRTPCSRDSTRRLAPRTSYGRFAFRSTRTGMPNLLSLLDTTGLLGRDTGNKFKRPELALRTHPLVS